MRLANRHRVNRILRECGLPNYRRLVALSRLTARRSDAAQHERTLGSETVRSGFGPASVYRAIRRLTGCTWTEVKGETSDELIVRVTGMHPG